MRKLTVFNFMTLYGFYKGPQGDISWHPHNDAEEQEYATHGLQSGSMLVFGRVTYEMMAGYWPSELAMNNDPVMATGMNKADKIVFSQTLQTAEWENTELVNGDLLGTIKKIKQLPGKDIAILGSGSIVPQLTNERLIDEYMLMIDPVAIGVGVPVFKDINSNLRPQLISSRVFQYGAVLMCYRTSTN